MTKLGEFRLKSYDERSMLQTAMYLFRDRYPDSPHKGAIEDLLIRLSKTECQPGGCEICNPRDNPEWECVSDG